MIFKSKQHIRDISCVKGRDGKTRYFLLPDYKMLLCVKMKNKKL